VIVRYKVFVRQFVRITLTYPVPRLPFTLFPLPDPGIALRLWERFLLCRLLLTFEQFSDPSLSAISTEQLHLSDRVFSFSYFREIGGVSWLRLRSRHSPGCSTAIVHHVPWLKTYIAGSTQIGPKPAFLSGHLLPFLGHGTSTLCGLMLYQSDGYSHSRRDHLCFGATDIGFLPHSRFSRHFKMTPSRG